MNYNNILQFKIYKYYNCIFFIKLTFKDNLIYKINNYISRDLNLCDVFSLGVTLI